MAVALATLFYALFLFDAPRQFYRDADTGWHIISGRSILATGEIPRTDPFSFSRAGQPWTSWEWGSDVLMASASRFRGLTGVTWLFLTAISLVAWLSLRLAWIGHASFLLVALMLPAITTTAGLHWLARPHVFGWIFVQLTFLAAESAQTRFRASTALAWAAVFALWANIHGSFILGVIILLLYAAGALARVRLYGDPEAAMRARWLAGSAAAGLAGTFLNPNGWQLHWHVAGYLTNRELLSRIAEFQSFNFMAEGATPVAITFLFCAAGTVAAFACGKLGRFLACAALLVFALRSARGLPLLAVAVLPLAAASISEALRRWRGLSPAADRARIAFVKYNDNLRVIDRRAGGYLWAPPALALAALFLLLPSVQSRTGFSPADFPVVLSKQVAELPTDGRILSNDKFGGYLIYRFEGQRKVFFDGRSDFYGVAFLKRYIDLMEARPGWQAAVTEYGFTHALLPRRAALGEVLKLSGWRVLGHDDASILLAAPTGRGAVKGETG